ncbi:hypothetical protein [Butyrivibrio sp. AE2005]|uniref:hypothetical protein n=1 Tax=Butyrivibrio sp. AE2005 TaxID=1496722 RepID=UPI00047C10E5|nr:hypothetical protein [Butyrivibrio sp. AE2005]
MKIRKVVMPLIVSVFNVVMLCGCQSDIQIFEDAGAKYKAVAISNMNLENDTYYVKEGTKFYEVFEAERSGGGGDIDSSRCAYYLGDYESKIPTYYLGELLAYASKSNSIDDVSLERYSDTGYSIGVSGAEWKDGYITFELKQDAVKKSDAASKFKNDRSDYIMIETINGKPVSADMLNKAGVFVGLEENKDYEISFWAGTYYGVTTVKADTHFFQAYEAFTLTNHEITRNGYIAIRLPDDSKTGYYYIDGKGLFRYVAEEKGQDLKALNYNEPYYESEEEQFAAYSQQFNFSIETQKVNGSIMATFDKDSVTDFTDTSDLKMMVTNPNGEVQMFKADAEEGAFCANYTTMMPGKWTVNISPQSLNVTDIEVKDNSAEQEMTQNTYTFQLDSDKTGIEFYVNYEGEGEVNAQVIGPDGQSHDLVKDRSNIGMIGYIYPFAEAGEYTINVYHYPDTKITEAEYEINTKNKQEEIITIEG